MINDLISNVQTSVALGSELFTADENGDDINRVGAGGGVMLQANVGVSLDTLSGSVYAELEVEESDDGITYTDVADDDLSDSVTGTNTGTFGVIDDPAEDDQEYKTEYRGSKQYCRVVLNLTGTHTNGIPVGVMALIGSPQLAPTD